MKVASAYIQGFMVTTRLMGLPADANSSFNYHYI